MRITRKSYERAKSAVEAARGQLAVVKTWEDVVRRFGNLGDRQQLVAIVVEEDGSIKAECELADSTGDRQASENKPEQRVQPS